MKVFKLDSQNEVQKIFKSHDVDVYVGKAFDDETNKNFLIFSIHSIKIIVNYNCHLNKNLSPLSDIY